MNNFLTVEDTNTLIYDNQDFYWHEIDTSKITDGTEDYTNIKYDFCKITRTNNNNSTYTTIITITTSNWTKGYYIDDNDATISITDNTITTTTTNPTIKISLYLGVIPFDTTTEIDYELINTTSSLTLKELTNPQTITIKSKEDSTTTDITQTLNKGYNAIEYNSNPIGYLFVNLLKTDFQFNCNQNLILGKINKVQLGTDPDYLPNGDYIGEYTPTITIQYGNKNIPLNYDENLNDYVFNLDLTEKNTPSKIKFKVNVETNDVLNESITSVILDADYETISTYDSLKDACWKDGATHIKLGADITLTSSISVTHYIKIIGNDKIINLNGKGFVLNEDVTFKAENIQFNNGNIAIKQGKNTTVELNGCTFNNNTGFGSCISCDIDYDSLSIADDYHTTLNDCLFNNNDTCIVHGGQLTVTNCRYHNTDTNYINSENVAFLYQMDGNATIENNIFDIDYDTDDLCTNQQNIGFAQALIQCGLTATINGASSTTLLQDNSLPFDHNASHVYAKYYYPQIEACVYTSPILSKEDKAVCYTVTGENWIFKQNCQVTRASTDTQNENRKIEWED